MYRSNAVNARTWTRYIFTDHLNEISHLAHNVRAQRVLSRLHCRLQLHPIRLPMGRQIHVDLVAPDSRTLVRCNKLLECIVPAYGMRASCNRDTTLTQKDNPTVGHAENGVGDVSVGVTSSPSAGLWTGSRTEQDQDPHPITSVKNSVKRLRWQIGRTGRSQVRQALRTRRALTAWTHQGRARLTKASRWPSADQPNRQFMQPNKTSCCITAEHGRTPIGRQLIWVKATHQTPFSSTQMAPIKGQEEHKTIDNGVECDQPSNRCDSSTTISDPSLSEERYTLVARSRSYEQFTDELPNTNTNMYWENQTANNVVPTPVNPQMNESGERAGTRAGAGVRNATVDASLGDSLRAKRVVHADPHLVDLSEHHWALLNGRTTSKDVTAMPTEECATGTQMDTSCHAYQTSLGDTHGQQSGTQPDHTRLRTNVVNNDDLGSVGLAGNAKPARTPCSSHSDSSPPAPEVRMSHSPGPTRLVQYSSTSKLVSSRSTSVVSPTLSPPVAKILSSPSPPPRQKRQQLQQPQQEQRQTQQTPTVQPNSSLHTKPPKRLIRMSEVKRGNTTECSTGRTLAGACASHDVATQFIAARTSCADMEAVHQTCDTPSPEKDSHKMLEPSHQEVRSLCQLSLGSRGEHPVDHIHPVTVEVRPYVCQVVRPDEPSVKIGRVPTIQSRTIPAYRARSIGVQAHGPISSSICARCSQGAVGASHHSNRRTNIMNPLSRTNGESSYCPNSKYQLRLRDTTSYGITSADGSGIGIWGLPDITVETTVNETIPVPTVTRSNPEKCGSHHPTGLTTPDMTTANQLFLTIPDTRPKANPSDVSVSQPPFDGTGFIDLKTAEVRRSSELLPIYVAASGETTSAERKHDWVQPKRMSHSDTELIDSIQSLENTVTKQLPSASRSQSPPLEQRRLRTRSSWSMDSNRLRICTVQRQVDLYRPVCMGKVFYCADLIYSANEFSGKRVAHVGSLRRWRDEIVQYPHFKEEPRELHGRCSSTSKPRNMILSSVSGDRGRDSNRSEQVLRKESASLISKKRSSSRCESASLRFSGPRRRAPTTKSSQSFNEPLSLRRSQHSKVQLFRRGRPVGPRIACRISRCVSQQSIGRNRITAMDKSKPVLTQVRTSRLSEAQLSLASSGEAEMKRTSLQQSFTVEDWVHSLRGSSTKTLPNSTKLQIHSYRQRRFAARRGSEKRNSMLFIPSPIKYQSRQRSRSVRDARRPPPKRATSSVPSNRTKKTVETETYEKQLIVLQQTVDPYRSQDPKLIKQSSNRSLSLPRHMDAVISGAAGTTERFPLRGHRTKRSKTTPRRVSTPICTMDKQEQTVQWDNSLDETITSVRDMQSVSRSILPLIRGGHHHGTRTASSVNYALKYGAEASNTSAGSPMLRKCLPGFHDEYSVTSTTGISSCRNHANRCTEEAASSEIRAVDKRLQAALQGTLDRILFEPNYQPAAAPTAGLGEQAETPNQVPGSRPGTAESSVCTSSTTSKLDLVEHEEGQSLPLNKSIDPRNAQISARLSKLRLPSTRRTQILSQSVHSEMTSPLWCCTPWRRVQRDCSK